MKQPHQLKLLALLLFTQSQSAISSFSSRVLLQTQIKKVTLRQVQCSQDFFKGEHQTFGQIGVLEPANDGELHLQSYWFSSVITDLIDKTTNADRYCNLLYKNKGNEPLIVEVSDRELIQILSLQ